MPQDTLYVHRLDPAAELPIRKSAGAAGYDLSWSVSRSDLVCSHAPPYVLCPLFLSVVLPAHVCSVADVTISARDRLLVPTGLAMSIPEGLYGRIAPRSGLASKHGIDVGAGVIDADYRGQSPLALAPCSFMGMPLIIPSHSTHLVADCWSLDRAGERAAFQP
jgi:dUTPase